MFEGEFNPFKHWIFLLVATSLLAFLRLFRRWLKWPQCPDEVLSRSSRVIMLGAVVFTALVIGIVTVNHWLIDQAFWHTWTHDNEAMLPLTMLVLFLLVLVLLTWMVEQVLRSLHPRYRAYIEELELWHPRPDRD